LGNGWKQQQRTRTSGQSLAQVTLVGRPRAISLAKDGPDTAQMYFPYFPAGLKRTIPDAQEQAIKLQISQSRSIKLNLQKKVLLSANEFKFKAKD